MRRNMGVLDLAALGLHRGSMQMTLQESNGDTYELKIPKFMLTFGSQAKIDMSADRPEEIRIEHSDHIQSFVMERHFMNMVLQDMELLRDGETGLYLSFERVG